MGRNHRKGRPKRKRTAVTLPPNTNSLPPSVGQTITLVTKPESRLREERSAHEESQRGGASTEHVPKERRGRSKRKGQTEEEELPLGLL